MKPGVASRKLWISICATAIVLLTVIVFVARMDTEPVPQIQSLINADTSNNINKYIPSEVHAARQTISSFYWPTLDEIAEAHHLPTGEPIERQVEALNRYVLGGTIERRAIAKSCQEMFGEHSEGMVGPSFDSIPCLAWAMEKRVRSSEYFTSDDDESGFAMRARKIKTKRERSSASKSNTWAARKWRTFRNRDYTRLAKRVHYRRWSQVAALAGEAWATREDCRYANARIALLWNLENFLPENKAWMEMTRLYEPTALCIQSNNSSFEILHQRMALLWLNRGDVKPATGALLRAAQARNPETRSRTLFWLGYLLSEVDSAHNSWWDELLEENPMTLHGLMAAYLRGQDPVDVVRGRPLPHVAAYSGPSWDSTNLFSMVFQLLYSVKSHAGLIEIAGFARNNLIPTNLESALFLSFAQQTAGNLSRGVSTLRATVNLLQAFDLNYEIVKLLYPLRHVAAIHELAPQVPASYVLGIIRQESTFNETARSPADAQGLMQILPMVGRQMLKTKKFDLFDPDTNIKVGGKFITHLLSRFDGSFVMASSAYNAGPTAARRWQKRFDTESQLLFADLIPYSETRLYVTNVMAGMYWYHAQLPQQIGLKWHSRSPLPLLAPNLKRLKIEREQIPRQALIEPNSSKELSN